MPKRVPEFHYFFRQVSDAQVDVTKYEPNDDSPLVTYHIKGSLRGPGRALCDCPAAHRFADRPDKHVGWVRRYLAIRDTGKYPADRIIYYNSRDDSFYAVGGSLTDMLLTEEGNGSSS